MDTRSRVRTGLALVLVAAAAALVVLGLATVYGLSVEYGGGSFADLAFLVVPVPVLAASLAVVAWPGASTRTRITTVLGTAVVMVGGGLAADALGKDAHRDRLLEESRTFTCTGPDAEVEVDAAVERTWQEMPRRRPVYGPIAGSATHCVAGVAGEGERAFADYTSALRRLDGWRVQVDRPQRFVTVRDEVRVTVQIAGAPDRLTTITVALRP